MSVVLCLTLAGLGRKWLGHSDEELEFARRQMPIQVMEEPGG